MVQYLDHGINTHIAKLTLDLEFAYPVSGMDKNGDFFYDNSKDIRYISVKD
jgi:hypothetical protein